MPAFQPQQAHPGKHRLCFHMDLFQIGELSHHLYRLVGIGLTPVVRLLQQQAAQGDIQQLCLCLPWLLVESDRGIKGNTAETSAIIRHGGPH